MKKLDFPSEINLIRVQNELLCGSKNDLGILTRSSVYHFQPIQDKQYVSLTMTEKGLGGYSFDSLHPIFSQNLPEGFNRRFIAKKLARQVRVDDMFLLALQADRGLGLLSYQSDLVLPPIDPLSLDDIIFDRAKHVSFPQLLEKYYLHSPIAGMQPKITFSDLGKTSLSDDSPQGRHYIVKSFDPIFPLLTVNEFVCMQAAKACGLEPPNHYLSENLEMYIVERFDRTSEGLTLGFENFSTLMKKPNIPSAKYSSSYENLLKATYLYTGSLVEVEKMYKQIVFNCLIGNGDAHLKNFGLIYTADMQNIVVAPPFDVTHTLIYENIDSNMALKLAGSKAFPTLSQLMRLAESNLFRIRNPMGIIESFAEQILHSLRYSNEVQLFKGLRESIESAVSNVMSSK